MEEKIEWLVNSIAPRKEKTKKKIKVTVKTVTNKKKEKAGKEEKFM